MPIERKLWTPPFSINNMPKWLCPKCLTGFICLKENGLQFEETSDSKSFREQNDLNILEATFIYTATFECVNPKCKTIVVSCGSGELKEVLLSFNEGNESFETKFIESLTPKFFFPNLKIIHIPNQCPISVEEEINNSFKLFFTNPSSSVNHIRQSMENVLNEKRIPRYKIKKGKRERLTLHNRIELFSAKNPSRAEKLTALKWIGNVGSHTKEITISDALDAYEILEMIMDEIYVKHEKRIVTLVKKINKRKGPIKNNEFTIK